MASQATEWQAIEDVPQEVIDRTASVWISYLSAEGPRDEVAQEARAILCALAPHSTAASNYLDPS